MKIEEKRGFRLSEKEYKFIVNLPSSRSLRGLANKTGISVSGALEIKKRLERRGKFHSVFNYRFFGLTPVAIIGREPVPSEFPLGTLTVRRLSGIGRYVLVTGLVPDEFVASFVSMLDMDIAAFVKGTAFLKWLPNEACTGLSDHILEPRWEGLKEKSLFIEKLETLETRVPDIIDAIILWGKIKYGPFYSVKKIIREALKVDEYLKGLTKQAVSYHYRRHVLPGWLYNTFIPRLSMEHIPLRIYYLEGRDAYLVALTLAHLPYFYTTYIDHGKVLVTGQVPCWMEYELYDKVLSVMDIKLPLGGLLASAPDVVFEIPKLWRYLESKGRRWTWKWKREKLRRGV